ncbi:hypothetical protein [Sanguibacter sp. HDW7]|uniref:hypothetical protein n=1 Tax=Sanguibacter sp. HDW7 TaxID=2714931 RepID=UPI00140ADDA8|nr:hypothetical protein [Sanguibacter sp. HDW7]QIK84200.1 hypothetical protein G7063_11665 [Sanguibacter sp. HDW7]
MKSFTQLRRRGAAALLVTVLAVPVVAVATATAAGTSTSVATAASAVRTATAADERAAANLSRAKTSRTKAAAKVTSTKKAAKKASAKRATAAKKYSVAKKKYAAAKKAAATRHGVGGANESRASMNRASKALKSATAASRRATQAKSKALVTYSRAKALVAKTTSAKAKTAKALTKAKNELDAAKRRPTPTPTQAPTTPAPAPTTPAPKPTTPSTVESASPARTAYTGPMTVSTNGAVIENKIITGQLKIRANNVTIRNSLFVGPATAPTANYFLLWNTEGNTGLKVIDSELRPTIKSSWMNGVIGAGFTLERVTITNVIDQVTIKGDDVTIKDSVFEGNLYYANDPNHGGKESHADNVQIQSGKRIKITGTTMRSANNATVQVTQALGAVADLTIADNFLDHGGCTINITEGTRGYGPLAGVRITDNTFGTNQRIASCAVIRPKTTVITATGNSFTDGRAFALKNG